MRNLLEGKCDRENMQKEWAKKKIRKKQTKNCSNFCVNIKCKKLYIMSIEGRLNATFELFSVHRRQPFVKNL